MTPNLTIRLSAVERKAAQLRAEQAGLRLGTYARAALLGPAPARDIARELAALTRCMARQEEATVALRRQVYELALKLVAGPPEE